MSVCQPKCSSMNMITAHLCVHYVFVCVTACVYRSVRSVCLILRSSPIHPLILLTYSPNPVIPGSYFHPAFYPFIPLSCYLSLASTAPLSLPPPFQPGSLLLPLSPHHHHLQSLTLPSLHPSIPLDPVLASLSRCLKAWHHGFFSRRVQSLPYENAVQGTALSSLQIKRLLTIQWWEARDLSPSQKETAQCSEVQIHVQVEV